MGSHTKKSSRAQLLALDRIATCIDDHHSWTVEGLIKNERETLLIWFELWLEPWLGLF